MSLKKDCFLYDVPEHKKHKLEIINLIKQIPKNSYNNITHTDWNLPPSLHRAWYDYFIKNKSYQKGEVEIEDGVSFRDNKGRVTIIVNSEDALNYIRHLYKEDITKLIQISQEVYGYDNSTDFTNKDTKFVIENVLTKE